MTLLSIRNVTMQFGGLVANSDISFDVARGTIFAVIGPNGAGKTTLFNVISGALAPTQGSVHLADHDITGLPATKIAQRGLIRTYQLVQLFKELTVAENVQVGAHRVTTGNVLPALLRPPSFKAQERDVQVEALRLLDFVGLQGRADLLADQLPYGQQRLLEVARALAAKPEIVLLDEPAAGLNTQETTALAEVIQRIRDMGITVLLIEHDMSLVMKVAERIAVLDFGRKIAEGTAAEIRQHPDVLAAYLGGTEHA